jgi:hemolysin III
MDDERYLAPRPRLRGRIHQVAFFVSVPAGISLVVLAETALARLGAAVYAVSLSGLYAASAAFHRIRWGYPAWRWMRKLDHSMIYLLIAGTYTPFALLVLDGAWSVGILAVVWTGAVVGIGFKLATFRLAALGSTLYITLGWVAIVTLPVIVTRLSVTGLVLLFAGGILYTSGAVIFLRKRPDPWPQVFGYHEIWHAMVVAASVCHYVLVAMLVA